MAQTQVAAADAKTIANIPSKAEVSGRMGSNSFAEVMAWVPAKTSLVVAAEAMDWDASNRFEGRSCKTDVNAKF